MLKGTKTWAVRLFKSILTKASVLLSFNFSQVMYGAFGKTVTDLLILGLLVLCYSIRVDEALSCLN